jgi:hypothetical protein
LWVINKSYQFISISINVVLNQVIQYAFTKVFNRTVFTLKMALRLCPNSFVCLKKPSKADMTVTDMTNKNVLEEKAGKTLTTF